MARGVPRLSREYERFRKDKRADPMMQEMVRHMRNSGMSKQAIAHKCGVSVSCLAAWERGAGNREGGTRRPNVSTLRFVGRALGMKMVLVPDE